MASNLTQQYGVQDFRVDGCSRKTCRVRQIAEVTKAVAEGDLTRCVGHVCDLSLDTHHRTDKSRFKRAARWRPWRTL